MKDFIIGHSSTIMKLSIETLMEEVRPLDMEDDEFEKQGKSIIRLIGRFGILRSETRKKRDHYSFEHFAKSLKLSI